MSSNVPQARSTIAVIEGRLRKMAKELEALTIELEQAREMMRRDYRNGKAPATATHMTDDIRRQIIAYKNKHPGVTQREIAEIFGVHPGRVSETLNGVK